MDFEYIDSIFISEDHLSKMVYKCKKECISPSMSYVIVIDENRNCYEDWEIDEFQRPEIAAPILDEIRNRLYQDGYREIWVKEE